MDPVYGQRGEGKKLVGRFVNIVHGNTDKGWLAIRDGEEVCMAAGGEPL